MIDCIIQHLLASICPYVFSIDGRVGDKRSDLPPPNEILVALRIQIQIDRVAVNDSELILTASSCPLRYNQAFGLQPA